MSTETKNKKRQIENLKQFMDRKKRAKKFAEQATGDSSFTLIGTNETREVHNVKEPARGFLTEKEGNTPLASGFITAIPPKVAELMLQRAKKEIAAREAITTQTLHNNRVASRG